MKIIMHIMHKNLILLFMLLHLTLWNILTNDCVDC